MKDKIIIIRSGINLLAIFIMMTAVGISILAQSVMIVDRGLPTANLNGLDIAPRSNVALGTPETYAFFGDDFTVPQPTAAGNWRIDTIRVWFVGGPADNDADKTNDSYLGDLSLGNLILWVGTNNNLLTKAAQSRFIPGSDATNNPNVVATRVQYSTGVFGVLDYENIPTRCNANGCYTRAEGYSTMVQLDFKNLNLTYPAGTLVRFGMFANLGGASTHASNAGLSGSPQAQSDGYVGTFKFRGSKAYYEFSWPNYPDNVFTDKPLDMNVQVFATLVNKGKK